MKGEVVELKQITIHVRVGKKDLEMNMWLNKEGFMQHSILELIDDNSFGCEEFFYKEEVLRVRQKDRKLKSTLVELAKKFLAS